MTVKTQSGVDIVVDSAAHVIFPLVNKVGDRFDLYLDDWESDRAWTIKKGRLIYNPTTKKVDRVLETC